MDTEDTLIERLTATQGDVQAQAALMAEFRLSVCPEPERLALREALDAAAVLHWFDAGLLALLLAIPEAEAGECCEGLKALTFVERYGRPELGLYNVHEATRLGWRRRLAAEDPGCFRELSARAAGCFAGDTAPLGRIEWVYHLLCADPNGGASALESMDRELTSGARPEQRVALARVRNELALPSPKVSARPIAKALRRIVSGLRRGLHRKSAQDPRDNVDVTRFGLSFASPGGSERVRVSGTVTKALRRVRGASLALARVPTMWARDLPRRRMHEMMTSAFLTSRSTLGTAAVVFAAATTVTVAFLNNSNRHAPSVEEIIGFKGQITQALHAGNVAAALEALSHIPKGSERTEECKHILNYATQSGTSDDSAAVNARCWPAH